MLKPLIAFRALWLALAVAPPLVFGTGLKTKGHCTLVLPVSAEVTDILSTGRIHTTSPAVQPMGDTFCVAGPEHALVCQGVDKPARVRIPGQVGDALNVRAKGSVCSVTPGKSSIPSWEDDVIVTGDSVLGLEELMLPDNPDIRAWEIHCRSLVKKEPSESDTPSTEADDQGYDSPIGDIEIASVSTPRGQGYTTCGRGQNFATMSLLNSHRRGSSTASARASGTPPVTVVSTSIRPVCFISTVRAAATVSARAGGTPPVIVVSTSIRSVCLTPTARAAATASARASGTPPVTVASA